MKHDQSKLVRRLKIIEGQVRGLQEMLEGGTYCVDVITQTSAVKRALSSVEDELMRTHLSTCVAEQMKRGDTKKAVDEIVKVYKIKRA